MIAAAASGRKARAQPQVHDSEEKIDARVTRRLFAAVTASCSGPQ
jgi:hypothetical protein